jgi:YesN/AraC family two-component response regulator
MTKPSVLIVDDESIICEGLKRVLSEHYTVYTALSGSEALAMLRNTPDIDVMLCDIIMPGMDGHEVIRTVRAENRTIKVIVITAFSDPHKVCEAMRLGANNFMLKPFDIPQLERMIENALASKRRPSRLPVAS